MREFTKLTGLCDGGFLFEYPERVSIWMRPRSTKSFSLEVRLRGIKINGHYAYPYFDWLTDHLPDAYWPFEDVVALSEPDIAFLTLRCDEHEPEPTVTNSR